MNEAERRRFEFLTRGTCVPLDYLHGYYGLQWPLPDDLGSSFAAWQRQRRRRSDCPEGTTSRYELEAFMQQKGGIPKKWMGARLGMTEASLDELLARLGEIDMQPHRYIIYADLIAEALTEDLVPNIPSLRFRTFYDHNSFCLRLHQELRSLLRINVEAVFCATSDRLQEYTRQIANNFDCLTLAPLSGKHQMWLDFRKPLNLGPDRCSKLLYAENREELRPYCAGTREPSDLDEYTRFLTGG